MFASERLPASRPYLVLALSVLALLAMSEIALRIYGLGNPIVYVNDSRAGFYPAPGQAKTRRKGAFFQINSFGMRAPEYRREPAPGTLRILMLGDSTLYGGNFVDQSEIYPRRLETALKKASHRTNLEVLNMGVNAWGPFQELGYITRFGTFGAAIAIICLPMDDVYRPLYGLERTPFFSSNHPPYLALEEVLVLLEFHHTAARVGKSSPQDRQNQKEKGIGAYVELVRRLQESGAEVTIEVLPSLESGFLGRVPSEEDQDVSELTASMKPYGVPVHFPVGLFRGQGRQDELYHDEIHLAEKGHPVYSRYLEQQIVNGSKRFQTWMQSPGPAVLAASRPAGTP